MTNIGWGITPFYVMMLGIKDWPRQWVGGQSYDVNVQIK
jgi:hypothetical protein